MTSSDDLKVGSLVLAPPLEPVIEATASFHFELVQAQVFAPEFETGPTPLFSHPANSTSPLGKTGWRWIDVATGDVVGQKVPVLEGFLGDDHRSYRAREMPTESSISSTALTGLVCPLTLS